MIRTQGPRTEREPQLVQLTGQPEQGPTKLLEQVKVDGSGSLIGGAIGQAATFLRVS
ncbi:hypothetical protein OHB35_00590 [Streptomyces phaeochromogenes]|uniref:Uncharacterized protein n=1 Tax=Streptomyces phaeochromogenes TaxID=1923 RepID=A0ABZ1GZW1_STRPH|nr:hypothetical protein [Streptomyces phaeochromogenes]WSD11832.1 hypothetical protein OHB35_00590 [Streptomyces phaeochromogenes]